MGAAESQEEKDERIKAESVFDPRYISWDHNGNLRYGNHHVFRLSGCFIIFV
jgi:hypothetical protein